MRMTREPVRQGREFSPLRSRIPPWLPLAAIVFLAALLRVYHLGAENLWIDEVFSMDQNRSPIRALDRFWRHEEGVSARPLGLMLIYFARQISESEFVVRLPYAMLGILDVGFLYLVARDLVERQVALRAAAFLALLPIHIWYSQEARWYAQWTFLTTVSFWALVRFWKTGRARWAVGYLVVTTLNLYTYVVTLQVIAVQVLTTLLLPGRRAPKGFRWKILTAVGTACLLAAPIFIAASGISVESEDDGVMGSRRSVSPVALIYVFFTYVAGFTVGPTLEELHDLPGPLTILWQHPEILVYCLVFAPLVGLGLWALRTRRSCAAVLLPWALALPLFVFGSSLITGQTLNIRYTLAATPGFAFLLALGVESTGRWRRWATILVTALFCVSLANYYWNPRYDKEDVRSAINYARQNSPQDPVAVVGQIAPAAVYYGEEMTVELLRGCSDRGEFATPRTPVVYLDALRHESSFWLLVGRDWADRSKECLEALESTHAAVDSLSLTGVDIYFMRHP